MVPSIPGASSDYGISKVCTVALVGSMDAFFLPNKARMAGKKAATGNLLCSFGM